MEINYHFGERMFPVSSNGVSVPISTKGFRLNDWDQFEERVRNAVLASLGEDFDGRIAIPYHAPSVRKSANSAMLYLLDTQSPTIKDIHVSLFTRDTSEDFVQDTGAIGFPRDAGDILQTTGDHEESSGNHPFGEMN